MTRRRSAQEMVDRVAQELRERRSQPDEPVPTRPSPAQREEELPPLRLCVSIALIVLGVLALLLVGSLLAEVAR